MTIEIENIDNNRVVLHFGNNFMLDVTTDSDGVIASLIKGDNQDAIIFAELSHDWNEPHINA